LVVWVVVERRARRGRRIEGGREVGVLVVWRMQRDTVRVVILVVVIDGSSSLRRLEFWDALLRVGPLARRVTNIIFDVPII